MNDMLPRTADTTCLGELAVAGRAQSPLGGSCESLNEVIAIDDFAPVRQWVLVRDPVERLRQGDRDPVGGQTAEGRAREGNPVLPGDRQGQQAHPQELVDLRYQGRGTRSEPRTRRGTFYKRQRDEVVSRARVAEACSGSDEKIGRSLPFQSLARRAAPRGSEADVPGPG